MRRRSGLMWFRRDLRLADNPAWSAATAEHARVTALYVLDDRLLSRAGPFRRHHLLADVEALDTTLRALGGRLLIRRGDPTDVVPREAARVGARCVHWNADVTPYATARDAAVREALGALGAGTDTPYGHLVLPPGSVLTAKGQLSRVFSAFHRAWRSTSWDPWPDPGDAVVADEAGDALPQSGRDPSGGGDAGGYAERASESLRPVGEDGAHATLAAFLEHGVDQYRAGRDRVSEPATSGLSVALRFGTISARRVIEAVGDAGADRQAFVRQLAWRDWFAHLLGERPDLTDHAMRPDHDRIAWRDDPHDLAAWKAGRTGYPIVDAGMRELAATGTMHNRVRMITASFLVKDLLIDWRRGERHFRHLLADGDVPQNVGNWQWVAGTGPDAAPYFRVLNPVAQSRAHDPHGVYLRRWVPEVARLDDTAIHAPWEAGAPALAAAEIVLGETYPGPLVDHADARRRALAAYRAAAR